jgi:hypothetical protein
MQMERFEANGVMQMQQHCWISNKQSLTYRMSWFKPRFIQYSQNFRVKIIKRRSSGANFIMQVLTTERCFCNRESNRSKLISMFTKLCLKSVNSLSAISRASAPSFQGNLMITLWSSDYTPSQTYFSRILRSRPGRPFFKKPDNRIRFDLFILPKGPHSRDTLTWKGNSRAQRGRLEHVLLYQTRTASLLSTFRQKRNKLSSEYFKENIVREFDLTVISCRAETGGSCTQLACVYILRMPLSTIYEWSYKQWQNATSTYLITQPTHKISHHVTSSFWSLARECSGPCPRRWRSWKRRSGWDYPGHPEVSKSQLIVVLREWQRRVDECIKNKGDYFEQNFVLCCQFSDISPGDRESGDTMDILYWSYFVFVWFQ